MVGELNVGDRVTFTVPDFPEPHLNEQLPAGPREGTITRHAHSDDFGAGIVPVWVIATALDAEPVYVAEGTWGLRAVEAAPRPVRRPRRPAPPPGLF